MKLASLWPPKFPQCNRPHLALCHHFLTSCGHTRQNTANTVWTRHSAGRGTIKHPDHSEAFLGVCLLTSRGEAAW